MLNSISYLNGSQVVATDTDIGHVKEAYFDDRSWALRYLVVDTGNWLAGREVLVSPYAVKQPVGNDKRIHVALTRQQVGDSPDVDTHQPVSRQHEHKQHNKVHWERPSGNLENIVPRHALKNEKIKSNWWRNLRLFNNQNNEYAKPHHVNSG